MPFIFQIISMIYVIFAGLAFVAAGLWYSEIFFSADFCEQNSQIVKGQFPTMGTGIFYYINCFSNVITML